MSTNRTTRTARAVVGGVLVAGVALLGGAAPALAGAGNSTSPSAPNAGGPDDAHPLGVPVIGLVNAVLKGATSIAPSNPYAAHAAGAAVATNEGAKVIGQ